MPKKTVINDDKLTSVEITDRYGDSCIKLAFENSEDRFLIRKIFDKNDLIFKKSEKLVGKNVFVTAWDPIGKPGLYSKNQWFSDVNETNTDEKRTKGILEIARPSSSENDKTQNKLIDKGPCVICGIEDNRVCYSEDGGESWMHYFCKFPV